MKASIVTSTYTCDNCGKAAVVVEEWDKSTWPFGWLRVSAPMQRDSEPRWHACSSDCAIALCATDIRARETVPA